MDATFSNEERKNFERKLNGAFKILRRKYKR